jgi:aminomethyltransferase
MEKSPLHSLHLSLGARLAPFAGWEMPIQYKGIVSEHEAVRKSVGVFDISHMGEFEVSGPGAGAWLNGLLTNDNHVLGDGEGQYTLLLNEEGGVIDDLILYRISGERYFLVVNASRIDDDFSWMSGHLPESGVTLSNRSRDFGAVAVQGPKSLYLWTDLAPGLVLPGRNGIALYEAQGELILCRTGYTGEDGFELFAPVDQIGHWFDQLVASGAIPCGLGARDTLRLEKGFPLNGSDLDETHTPLEAGLGFFVKLDKPGGFIGRDALLAQKEAGVPTKLAAICLNEKAPPLRHGYEVLASDGVTKLAELSSGSLSPGLGLGIGMAYLPTARAAIGTEVMISIREKLYPGRVVKKPFV